MDKSWMNLSRISPQYHDGVESFLSFAFEKSSIHGMILCPCIECGNGVMRPKVDVREHLIVKGFIKGYTYWIAHGELTCPQSTVNNSECSSSTHHTPDDMQSMLHDVCGMPVEDQTVIENDITMPDVPNALARKFYLLIDEWKQELYPGCENYSALSFILRLLRIKCMGKWSNTHFTMLLDLLRDSLPNGVKLPKSYYECERLMKDLGLGYEKIDACPNDCMLYWRDRSGLMYCTTCEESRWVTSDDDLDGSKRKIARKSLWHFPLKQRLQRLYMSPKAASNMRWHEEGRIKDGFLRHPADSPAWKTFDHHYPSFAKECRNVRLGLASDGFNPFKNMSTSHSTWPVVLIPYNLPPWMCMKQPNFILSLLIPGPTSPGNNIDVYLEPLICELKELWQDGVETYDASCKQNFQMHAALLWTISDFPGYANLSGWSTKGKLACPVCHKHTSYVQLKHCKKTCYMGHRRFLPSNHHFRRNKEKFDGSQDFRRPPPRLTSSMRINELKGFKVKFGKKVVDNPKLLNWKKNSIFNELPYWKDNLVPNNLDVMHIEKNVTDNIHGTLIDTEGKTKDHYKSRLDLKEMGIRPELHPINRGSGKAYLPPSLFTLSKKEKSTFCKVLKKIKVPDGYSANISRCVQLNPPKLFGLKSHDNHILMQQLMPIAIRKILPKAVRFPLLKLSKYFRQLCAKELVPEEVLQLEKDIAIVLCELETVFPPSFFDIMVHLTVHLATEVRLAGPVHYRWMYPIERYLSTLKSYVRNRNHPEGSIAEGYLAEECLTFCSKYLADYVEAKSVDGGRNEDVGGEPYIGLAVFSYPGNALGRPIPTIFEVEAVKKAHQYVLFNCEEVQPFIESGKYFIALSTFSYLFSKKLKINMQGVYVCRKHLTLLQREKPHLRRHELERVHCESFADWFVDHVDDWPMTGEARVHADLKMLAKKPNHIGLKYEKFIINGFRFHIRDVEQRRKTQNSGVIVNASTSSFSSTRDDNPIQSEVAYYGILKPIIELDYRGGRRVVMFECDWVSTGGRLKKDENGFTLVNFANIRPHDEPYILASQASQVFYVEDPTEKDWKVVITTSSRSAYKMCRAHDVDTYLQGGIDDPTSNDGDEGFSVVREGVRGVEINVEET